MVNLNDVVAANNLLMSLGAPDAMPTIAATAIENSLEQQHRIERAIDYAEHTPPNSAHARQMARILDGSITVEDELKELHGVGIGPREVAAAEKKATKGVRGKLKPGAGLQGRSTRQRKEMREWLNEHGYNVDKPGRIPQQYIDIYDEAQAELRKMRMQQRQQSDQPEQLELSQTA